MIGFDWYIAAALLQLAERAGGFAQGPVVLPPQRGRGLRRGDDDPCRRSGAHGLSPAHRGGMGIRLPGGYGHQPLLRSLDRPCWTLMLGIKPTARSMPGRAGACCRTTWDCSTCWGTCLNGARKTVYVKDKRERIIDFIYRSESINDKTPRPMRGGSFSNLPAYVRSAVRYRIAPMGRESDRGLRPSRTYP